MAGWDWRLLLVFTVAPLLADAQQTCTSGVRIEGIVTDPSGAVIPGAQVQELPHGIKVLTDESGHYVLPCISASAKTILAAAEGFASGTAQVRSRPGGTTRINLHLSIASVKTDVEVGSETPGDDSGRSAATTALDARQVQQLADDPDDFLTQLQALAGAGGGPGESALVVVDGFQNPTVLPPKSAIASIKIDPDLFSAEYESAPWNGGVIEISTKPGARKWHGALFYTDSEGAFNATNPFSVSTTPASKRRYGFELNGPGFSKTSDFAASLEKRDITEFNVVNATTLNSAGQQTPLRQTVEAPQDLWIGSARTDWQVSPKDVAALTFTARSNGQGNQGVGGLVLPEAGYSSQGNQYDLRAMNNWTISPTLLHETRIAFSWKSNRQTPNSTNPALQVSGFFVGGGATSQALNEKERDLEIDDDLIGSHGKHNWKVGVQSLGIFMHDNIPDTFNGSYVFGGGSAPILDNNNNPTQAVQTITPIEQYRRALLGLPGGAPTIFQITTGTPLVAFTQWRVGGYIQDNVKVASRLTLFTGLRYQFQTTPESQVNFEPRAALIWSPDKASKWVIHFRAGLFSSHTDPSLAATVYRLNNILQKQTTVYFPNFVNPLAPAVNSIAVGTDWRFPKEFQQPPTFGSDVGIEHEFPHHWIVQAANTVGVGWNQLRQRNINAPEVASEVGSAPDLTAALKAPRPLAENQNMFQYENTGHSWGTMLLVGVKQTSYKWMTLNANYLYMITAWQDGQWSTPPAPQSSYSKVGDTGRPYWFSPHVFSLFGTFNLPGKFILAEQFRARSGRRFDITTGSDNNGDGIFNDRPAYINGTASVVYPTRYGTLTTDTVNGNLPRNTGIMPSVAYLDLNLSRVWILNPNNKENPRSLTFNIRSANVLNHTNISTVNTVLSSGSVGSPVAADSARRMEIGVRFSF